VVDRLVAKMMALNPRQRFQTPSQLLEAIHAAVAGEQLPTSIAASATPERSVFIVEKNRRLMEAMRENFKKLGYRVMLAAESSIARERFSQQPFDALILDAGTAGVDGLRAFEDMSKMAARKGREFVGILILSQDQAEWTKLVPYNPKVVVMVRPLTLGQLIETLTKLVPAPNPSMLGSQPSAKPDE
jgi:CheY-like chemotaxis protein